MKLTKKAVVVSLALLLGACGSLSSKEVKLAEIEGTWNTVRFESGGKTQTPESPVRFVITKDKLTQEGSGLSFSDPFEIKGDSIILKTASGDLIYKILEISGDTMTLEAKAALGSTIYHLKKQ